MMTHVPRSEHSFPPAPVGHAILMSDDPSVVLAKPLLGGRVPKPPKYWSTASGSYRNKRQAVDVQKATGNGMSM